MTTTTAAGDHRSDQAVPCLVHQIGLVFGHMSDQLSVTGQLLDNSETDRAEILDRLLDSARTVIAREGFEGLTVQAIACEAGVNVSSAHTYFGSDAQLISEVLWRQLISAPQTRAISGQMTSSRENDLRSDALDVLRLRARTAGEIQRRIRRAGAAPRHHDPPEPGGDLHRRPVRRRNRVRRGFLRRPLVRTARAAHTRPSLAVQASTCTAPEHVGQGDDGAEDPPQLPVR